MRAARPSTVALFTGLLALACGSCISVSWQRASQSVVVDPSWRDLRIGETELATALERLGAPLFVYEDQVHGVVLVWGRTLLDQNGFNFSVPVSDNASASLDYSEGQAALRGVLLLFDADWRLSLIREGYLRDLTAGRELRPALPIQRPGAAPQETNE